jgi:hypothetical protein
MWLPCCSSNSYPIIWKALTARVPEITGSIAMLAEALQVSFDGLPDVLGRFPASSPLGNTPRQSWTCGYEHPVFVLLQIHAYFVTQPF